LIAYTQRKYCLVTFQQVFLSRCEMIS